MAVVVKHIIDPLPLPRSKNPELPEEIERVILKSLSKDPADRFQDADEMAKALKEAVKGLPAGVAQAVPAVPVAQVTTMVDEAEVAAEAEESAQKISEGVAKPKAVPSSTSGKGGIFSGNGRIAAATVGGLLLLSVVIVGAIQLFGSATDEPDESRTQEQIVADARAALEGDDPSAALEGLDLAIEGDPENVDLFFERAHAFADSGEHDLAFDSIQQGIEVSPEEAWVHESAANTLWEIGFFDEAIDEYRRAVEIDPQVYWLYYNIAEIYEQTGRPDEAIGTLFEAIENPHLAADPNELDSIGWYFLSFDMLNEAEEAFNKAIEIEPDNPSLYEGMLDIAYRRGGAPAGIEMAEDGIRQFPEHAPFYELAAYWFWEQDDLNQAVLAFNTALELDPRNPGLYGSLASVLVELGREAEATELIQSGIERFPNASQSYIVAADFYMAIGEIDEALRLYERSIELDPEDGWLYASYARATVETGGHDTARELLEEASAKNPGDPWLDEFIGWPYMMMNDCEQAVDHFERSLAVDPSIESAEQGIQECGG